MDWKYKNDRTNITHDKGAGRPSRAITEHKIERVCDMVLLDRRVTTDEVAHVLKISHGSANGMMHNKLGFHKVCARWVAMQVTDVHKQTCMDIWQKHLDRYGNERVIILDRIITGDVTWVHHYEPESKRQSMEWKHPQSLFKKNPIIRRKTDAYRVLGLTRPSTRTLSGEEHNSSLTGWSLQFEANAEDYRRNVLRCCTTISIHILLLTLLKRSGNSSLK